MGLTAEQGDGERLARIEEQLNGVREDVGEIKTSIRDATNIMSQMHVTYVPRTEIEKMVEARDKEQEAQNKQIEALTKKVDNLSTWRNRMVGAFAVVGFSLTILASYIRDIINLLHK